ncbi:MAG: hypothetical protein ABI425_05975 [Patescibacteria group bacterium]
MNGNENAQRIIAGPCSLESEEHAKLTIEGAKNSGINTIRMNLWKPRTKPGFEGMGDNGVPWVREAAEQGLIPALEVIVPEHVDLLMEEVLAKVPHATLLVWIGSRNQNHIVQRDIGRAVAGEDRIELMVKNQPWRDKDHWRGIVEHAIDGGAALRQMLLCHRGFAPWDKSSSETRNILDWEMAADLKNELGIPLIMDPSHIGGKSEKVKELIKQFSLLPGIDGQIIEVHPEPQSALTDAKQQLTWSELNSLIKGRQ